jgi:hypothetical protein
MGTGCMTGTGPIYYPVCGKAIEIWSERVFEWLPREAGNPAGTAKLNVARFDFRPMTIDSVLA